MPSRFPRVTRRAVALGAAVAVGLSAGGLVAVQVRAVQAQEARDEATAAAEAEVAERELRAQEEAQAEAAEALAQEWTAAVEEATPHLTAADATLADSLGRVADESVRDALGAAIDAVRTMLPEPAEGSAAPTATSTGGSATDAADLAPSSPEDLRDAVAAMTAATAAVTAAQLAWQAEQDALAAQQEAARQEAARREAQEPALGGPPSTGAGPDCGGPGSYEPPKNEGPTFYTSTPGTDGDGSNGRIPASQMTPLGWCTDSQGNQQWLRSDAAAALTRLNEAFRAEFSENIAVDLSYRSYEDQVEMREAYGSVAARPGTSNHGTGTAIDTWEWAAYSFGSARYEWLVTHGPEHGWVAPDWARQGGSNPEYWHFEFVG